MELSVVHVYYHETFDSFLISAFKVITNLVEYWIDLHFCICNMRLYLRHICIVFRPDLAPQTNAKNATMEHLNSLTVAMFVLFVPVPVSRLDQL